MLISVLFKDTHMPSIKCINFGNELKPSTIAMNPHRNKGMKPNTSFVPFPTLQPRDLWYRPLLLSTLLLHTNDVILNTWRRTLLLQIALFLSLVHVWHVPWYVRASQRAARGSWVSPWTLWSGTGLRSSGLAASAYVYCAISLAPTASSLCFWERLAMAPTLTSLIFLFICLNLSNAEITDMPQYLAKGRSLVEFGHGV